MNTKRKKTDIRFYLLIVPIALLVLLNVDQSSIKSYLFANVLFIGIHFILREKDEFKTNFLLYHIYLGVGALLYSIFLSQTPEWEGVTSLVAFDDFGFYAQIAGYENVSYDWIKERTSFHNFARFYRYLYPFKVETPLNIVTVNVIWTALVPYYSKKLVYQITKNENISHISLVLVAICPFTTYFGCIILRESIVTLCVIACLYHYLKKEYLFFIAFFAFLYYIRFGSIAYLVIGLLVLIRRNDIISNKNSNRTMVYMVLAIILFNVFYAYIQDLAGGKLGESIFRRLEGSYWDGTTISKLAKFPFPLNIIMTTVFFIFCPLFSFPETKFGHYMPLSFFNGLLTPFLFFFLWYPIANVILTYRKKQDYNAQAFVSFVIAFAILLGSIDLQIRHKTILYPFLCMLASYGYVHFEKKQKIISFFITATIVIAQLAFAIRNLH